MARPIRLYWYRSGKGTRRVNFGDDLSPLLVGLLAGRAVEHAPPHLADLLAVGSVLQHLGRNLRKPHCWIERLRLRRLSRIHVWGSGSFGPDDLPAGPLVRVHALRGPRTRDAMRAAPGLPLGDPGLLVDRLDLPQAPRMRWAIVPHVDDVAAPGVAMLAEALAPARVVDLTDADIARTVAAIRASDFVISSSLHGLVTADAFGVPGVWLSLRDGFYGGDWKFHDHFAAVGRTLPGPLRLRAGGEVPDRAALEAMAGAANQATVERRRAGLVEAFGRIGF